MDFTLAQQVEMEARLSDTKAGFKVYRDLLKPLMGRAMALVLLVPALLLMLLIAAILFFYRGRRLIFIQERIGYLEKPFRLYKFSTLLDKYNANGKLLPENERLFTFGNFLRHYHLDELPQIFNMLKGDLCFIGPRPLLPEYLPYYTPEQHRRHSCRPGITGLSQVAGGNLLGWPYRLRLDSFYARHCSFSLDLIVVVRSIRYFAIKKFRPSPESLFAVSFIDYMKGSKSKV